MINSEGQPEGVMRWGRRREESAPSLPPRSHLYSIAPVAVGTSAVESFSSYIARLAQEHCVTPATLLRQEFGPLLQRLPGKPHQSPRARAGDSSHYFHSIDCSINGISDATRDRVRIAEALTLRNDLRGLTLLAWRDVLAPEYLVRRTRAWCPDCFAEWEQSGGTIYEPFLWSLEAVTLCLKHLRQLQTHCPRKDCLRSEPALAANARPGRCSHCTRWLGAASVPRMPRAVLSIQGPAIARTFGPDELEWQEWVQRNACELTDVRSQLLRPVPLGRFKSALASAIESAFSDKKVAYVRFSEKVGLHSATLRDMALGPHRVRIRRLLYLAYCINVSLLDLLAPNATAESKLTEAVETFMARGSDSEKARGTLNPSTLSRL